MPANLFKNELFQKKFSRIFFPSLFFFVYNVLDKWKIKGTLPKVSHVEHPGNNIKKDN